MSDATASALTQEVPFTRRAVVKHLVVLEHAGLVTRHRQGPRGPLPHRPGRLDEATRAMAQLADEWDRWLGAIKRLAEAAYQNANDPGERRA